MNCFSLATLIGQTPKGFSIPIMHYTHAWAVLVRASLTSPRSNIYYSQLPEPREPVRPVVEPKINPSLLFWDPLPHLNSRPRYLVMRRDYPFPELLVIFLWPKLITSSWWHCSTYVFITNGFRDMLLDMEWKLLRLDPFYIFLKGFQFNQFYGENCCVFKLPLIRTVIVFIDPFPPITTTYLFRYVWIYFWPIKMQGTGLPL